MPKLLTCLLTLAVAAVLFLFAGCNARKTEPKPQEVRQPGEPVPYVTKYYIPRGEEKIYFATEDDLKLAIARQQAANQTPQQPH